MLAAPNAGVLAAPKAGAEAPNVVAPPNGDAPKAAARSGTQGDSGLSTASGCNTLEAALAPLNHKQALQSAATSHSNTSCNTTCSNMAAPPADAAPKAGAGEATKAGVLEAPKGLAAAVAPKAPNAGLAPNAPPGAAPNAGALAAPKAGVLAAPKAGAGEAPNAGAGEAPNAGWDCMQHGV